MGKCGAFISTFARFVLYLVVVVGTAATLWGMVSSEVKNSSCWLGGSTCLLFGSVASNATRCGVSQLHLPTSSGDHSCRFVVFFNAAQILAAAALCVLSLVVARGRTDGHNVQSWRRGAKFGELVAVSVLLLCSLAAAITVSIGLAVFCHEVEEHFRNEPSNLVYGNGTAHHVALDVHKHAAVKNAGHFDGRCKSAYAIQDVVVSYNTTGQLSYTSTYNKVPFFHYYNIAQFAAWISALAWLLHLPISIVAFRRRDTVEELPYTLRPSDSVNSLDEDLLT